MYPMGYLPLWAFFKEKKWKRRQACFLQIGAVICFVSLQLSMN